MFEVESDIPIPRSGMGRPKYPWPDMKVGDSFFVPNRPDGSRPAVSSAASYQMGRSGKKATYSTRKEAGGVRIWRVG